MDTIKILHVVNSLELGGMENGVANLINHTDSQRYHHEICCIRKTGPVENRLKRPASVHELGKSEGNDWRIIPKLMKIIRDTRPDIVHTRNWSTVDGIMAAKLAGATSIIHGEHGWAIDDPHGENKKRHVVRRLLSYGVDQFITVSEDLRQWLHSSSGVRLDKTLKINNGVDTFLFGPSQNTQSLKAKWNIGDEIVIGVAGRLDPIKNHDLLFKAFAELDHQNFNLSLVVVGDGRERSRLENLKESLPCSRKIHFLGQRRNMSEIYKLMDIFVLPSQNEGIANTILEAMSSNLPVIATDVGGNPELVDHNKNGFLITPGSAQSIRKALNIYIKHEDLRKQHGDAARQKAIGKFSIEQMIRKYERLYEQQFKNHRH